MNNKYILIFALLISSALLYGCAKIDSVQPFDDAQAKTLVENSYNLKKQDYKNTAK